VNSPSPFLAWQLVDSAFPTGAFAHSWGLEAAWQHGEIEDAEALVRFVDAVLRQTAYGLVPLFNAAFDDPDRWSDLDELAQAFLTNAVANRASRQQGRTLLTTAVRIWPCAELDAAKALSAHLSVHLGPVSGIVFRQIGVSRDTGQQVLLYGAARGVLSAAVRLGIVGSYEAQRMQRDCADSLEQLSVACVALGVEDLMQIAPIPDMLQATHDRLYSRLFQS
jgi:urease accessory protein